MSFVRFTPVMRFYWDVFRLSYAGHTFLSVCLAFDHACCLPHSAKQNGLRDVPFLFRRGSGSLFARSRMSRGYRALLVHFGLVRFLAAIPTENERERGRRRTESAARQSAFLRDRISFAMFSAGSPLGAARPRLRQRVFDSLDSPHAAAGLCWYVFAAPSPGYTERPARVQFMLGRVGLYIDAICYINRPDSKRPQALKSRVARAKRRGSRTAARGRRCGRAAR